VPLRRAVSEEPALAKHWVSELRLPLGSEAVATAIGVGVGVATTTGLGVILDAGFTIVIDGVAEPIGRGVAIATEGAGVTFEVAPRPRK
jgi:hypothetical protein